MIDIAGGAPIIRYDVVIAYAVRDIEQGSWVEECGVRMPPPRELDGLPVATRIAPPQRPLTGYTFEGYRNADGSVATRNILAITTTVQCVAGVVEHAVKRIKAELLPRYPNVEDVVALEHTYGCGVAIDAPGAEIPIRTLRNISRRPHPWAGGVVMHPGRRGCVGRSGRAGCDIHFGHGVSPPTLLRHRKSHARTAATIASLPARINCP